MKSIIMLILITFFLYLPQTLYGQEKDEPFNFPYGNIPFGESMDIVLDMVRGAEISEDEYATLEAARFYEGLSKYFPSGIYTSLGVPYHLNYKIVKKLKVKSSNWNNIDEIELFFVKEFNVGEPYTLFLIRKHFKFRGGHFKDVFFGMKEAITQTIGVVPEEFETTYHSIDEYYRETYSQAIVGAWILVNRKTFLLVWSNFGLTNREVLYVDNVGWNKYIKSNQAYEDDKKEKEKNRAKEEIYEF